MIFQELMEKILQVHLPKDVIDDMNIVIVLTIKQRKPAYPIRLIDDKTNNMLYVFDSIREWEKNYVLVMESLIGIMFPIGRETISEWSGRQELI
jgi:hypothetical protein